MKTNNLKQDEWDKIEKEFLTGLTKYWEEIDESITHLRKNSDNPYLRSQLCLALIAADTFSRFYKVFQGERKNLDKKNELRFKDWLSQFVFTDKNKAYKSYRNRIKCNPEIVWKLRNSFLHFYSFPEQKEKENRILFSYSRPEKEDREMEKKLRLEGHKVVFIDIYYLIRAILGGFILQLESFVEMMERRPKEYVESVLFAHKIIMQEGASTIRLKKQ